MMPENLNRADILDDRRAREAARIFDEYIRMNTPDSSPRGEITALPPDPDEVVADVVFGKGTGNLGADLALGLAGPLAGPITEAAGGQSGVLDWLPGGSLAKAGVVAVPRIAGKVARAVKKLTLDEMEALVSRKPKYLKLEAWLRQNNVDPEDLNAARAAAEGRNIYDWVANGWRSSEHRIPEYDILLPKNSTEADRRAVFVADSLAKHVLKDLTVDSDQHFQRIDDARHKATNYEQLFPRFNEELLKNWEKGNLPSTPNVEIAPMPDGSGAFINGRLADLYDFLFRSRVNRKILETAR
jgi:hypothetical protein